MPFKSKWHALTKASIILEPMLRHLQGLGFNTIFTPSLGFSDAIDHRRIRLNADQLPLKKESNFPIFAWSRSPVVVSEEIGQMRRIKVGSTPELNTGVPYPINYAGASFSLNWIILFNNITDFEEFEVIYTTEKLFSDFRQFKVFLPPIYSFANLDEDNRSIYIGSEWKMFSNIDTVKLSEYVHFSLAGEAQITFPALSITEEEISVKKLGEIHLGFYSDLEFDNLREKFIMSRRFDDQNYPITTEDTIKQVYKNEQQIMP